MLLLIFNSLKNPEIVPGSLKNFLKSENDKPEDAAKNTAANS
jgi:hypothetical protein